jgi:hypothetical protein
MERECTQTSAVEKTDQVFSSDASLSMQVYRSPSLHRSVVITPSAAKCPIQAFVIVVDSRALQPIMHPQFCAATSYLPLSNHRRVCESDR